MIYTFAEMANSHAHTHTHAKQKHKENNDYEKQTEQLCTELQRQQDSEK